MSEVVIFDIETDGLQATKLHCLVDSKGRKLTTDDSIRGWCLDRLEAGDTVVGHNIIGYDLPTLERLLGIDLGGLKAIDTLGLSWYCFPKVVMHGLEAWGERLKIAKPKIDDWENLSLEEYVHRCEEDVKINTKLWGAINTRLSTLYGAGRYDHVIDHLNMKVRHLAHMDKVGWRLDVEGAQELLERLEGELSEAVDALARVMPKVPKLGVRKPPKVRFKKDGSPSAHWNKWVALCEEHGVDPATTKELEVVLKHVEPNPNSHSQVKDWLFSLGWVPQNFKYIREGWDKVNNKPIERSIPQLKGRNGEPLCPSIEKLVETVPELAHLRRKSILAHRLAIVKGWLRDVDSNGLLHAGAAGFTNTLRLRHRTLVNIPSVRAELGAELRSLLIANNPETHVVLGADMSSLEDRTKRHYMMPYDPAYVEEMSAEGYDPHLDIAVQASLLTQEEANEYKAGNHKPEWVQSRHAAKTANYACTYGAGPQTISRGAGIDLKVAEKVHKAYWNRNWSLKAISEDARVKTNVGGSDWVFNPVSRLWLPLRSRKDAFSTLNQSTGAYAFDLWFEELVRMGAQISGQFHDEVIVQVRKGKEESAVAAVKRAVAIVNQKVQLNVELSVDAEIGVNYAEVH